MTYNTEDKDYTFREFYISDHMMGALRRYIDEGLPTGHFLTAVLNNNLSEAVSRADNETLANLPAFCAYLYWEAPSQCHGSPEKVSAWIASFNN